MLALLSAVALGAVYHAGPPAACTHLPTPPRTAAVANDNRKRAGVLEGNTLTVRLVAQRAAWRPDGATGCALGVNAFGEEGKPVSIPGPLIRVSAGTEVRVTVRNALPTGLWVRGLQDRAAGSKLDSVQVLPGASREFRFTAVTPGGWFYWAGSTALSGAQRLDRMTETRAGAGKRDHHTDTNGNHASHDMGGLVMALEVRPPRGQHAVAPPPAPARTLRLDANERPNKFGNHPGYGFIVQEGATPPAADSIRIPGSPLVLTKGEPVQIVVKNRQTIPMSVHWHGLELDSYFDGVGGFSGDGRRIAPMIAPNDSFVVRLTPPRAGTYMYHPRRAR